MLNRREFIWQGATLAASARPQRARSQRIRIGAQTNTWGVPLKSYEHVLQVAESLARLGYEAFETNHRGLEPFAAKARECRSAFEARRIAYLGPHFGTDLFDPAKVPAELDTIRRVAAYSAEMGATHFMLSGRRLPKRDGKLDRDAVRTKTAALDRAGQICRDAGLKLCYHNHRQEFEDEPSEISFLVAETDPTLVWFNYDVGNPYVPGFDPTAFASRHGSRIAVYHLKDVEVDAGGRRTTTDLGAGRVDLKGLLQPLVRGSWEGWLVVEREGSYPRPEESPEEKLRQCREYLRSVTGI